MARLPPPRLYAQVAARAPVAAVFRHGPHGRWSIGRWDLDADTFTPGACLRGTLYPRRCDLSPDGQLLYAFVLKPHVRGFLGAEGGTLTYSTVSNLPWLFALTAWRESGTWTRGYHFVEGSRAEDRPWEIRVQEGDAGPLRERYGMAMTGVVQYAAERRRGWVEHEDCPARDPGDVWDEGRRVILAKARPGGGGRLVMADQGWSPEGPGTIEGRRPVYTLELRRRRAEIREAVWADWDHRGRLLLATEDGKLQVRDVDAPPAGVVWERDLSGLRPRRGPAPAWARRW